MPEVPWYEAVDMIRPYVVRISTPRGSGTGFVLWTSKPTPLCVIATAAHVIDHAHYWEEPLRLDHVTSGKSILVRHHERAIILDAERDTAAIFFERGDEPLPTEPLPLAPEGRQLRVGSEIGWIGFPAIPAADLCFFGGRISAWLQRAYLVDGVAINGVSGGPAFHPHDNSLLVMGVVSAYVPNRATGETLPGLAVVRDVSQFHDLAPTFGTLEQAKSKETPPATTPPAIEPAAEGEQPSKRTL